MNELKLLPCPFCGGEAKVTTRDVEPQGDPWYGANMQTFVVCTKCGACLFDECFHEGFADEREAIAAWNRRTQPDHIVDAMKLMPQPNEPLTLHLGDGKHFIADYSYLDSHIVGICAYPRESDDGVIGAEDIGSMGKTTESVGTVLKIEFSKREAIDVVIRALERAKCNRPDAPLTPEEITALVTERDQYKAALQNWHEDGGSES